MPRLHEPDQRPSLKSSPDIELSGFEQDIRFNIQGTGNFFYCVDAR